MLKAVRRPTTFRRRGKGVLKTGIYAITNIRTGKVYIGRSVDMPARLYQHWWQLRRGTHSNPYLQASFNKDGEDGFVFAPILVARREDLPLYERLAIIAFRSHEAASGFNLTEPSDRVLTHTAKARAAISAFQREHQRTNRYEMTAEIKAKISAALLGRQGCNKGRVWSPEVRATMGAPKGNKNRVGKARSPDDRANLSAKLKAYFSKNPEAVKAMSAQRLGRKTSFETKAKQSAAHRARWARRLANE